MNNYKHIARTFVLSSSIACSAFASSDSESDDVVDFSLSLGTATSELHYVILGNKHAFEGRAGVEKIPPAVPCLNLPALDNTTTPANEGIHVITSSGTRKREEILHGAQLDHLYKLLEEAEDEGEKEIIRELARENFGVTFTSIAQKAVMTQPETLSNDAEESISVSPPIQTYDYLRKWDTGPET